MTTADSLEDLGAGKIL